MRKIIFVGLLVLTASSAAAREKGMPSLRGEFKPEVGSWAEYEYSDVSRGKKKDVGRFKVAVVGKEGDFFWIEQHFSSNGEGEGSMAMKMLVGGGGAEPKKVLMKTGKGIMDMTRLSRAAAPGGFPG